MNEKMKPRYGKFSLGMYFSWGSTLIFLIVALMLQIIYEINVLLIVFLLMTLQICSRHFEWFSVCSSHITVKKVFTKKEIPLPNELNLIFVKANVLSWLHRRITSSEQLIWLNGRYMVCVVTKAPLEETLQILKWNHFRKCDQYSNEIVKELFQSHTYYDFIYSFVYEPNQLKKLVENRSCQIIAPESLKGKINFDELGIPVYFDEEA